MHETTLFIVLNSSSLLGKTTCCLFLSTAVAPKCHVPCSLLPLLFTLNLLANMLRGRPIGPRVHMTQPVPREIKRGTVEGVGPAARSTTGPKKFKRSWTLLRTNFQLAPRAGKLSVRGSRIGQQPQAILHVLTVPLSSSSSR